MTLSKIGIKHDGRQQVVFSADDFAVLALEKAGLFVESVVEVPDDDWYTTDREGLMVKGEDGVDVEFEGPILSTDNAAIFGSESAQTLIEDAGVDAGYQQVADEIAANADALDRDDYAAIAVALQLAWDNANAGSHKNRDRAVRQVLGGMRDSYGRTLEKVERRLAQLNA